MHGKSNHAPNRDPLSGHLARGRIDRAQFLAAQEFRKHYGASREAQLVKCRQLFELKLHLLSKRALCSERLPYNWRRSFSISSLKWLIRASVLERSALALAASAWAPAASASA
jgi:hypothetical protein